MRFIQLLYLLSLGVVLLFAACGTQQELADMPPGCSGKCEGSPSPPTNIVVIQHLASCRATEVESCTDPTFCRDLIQCTVKQPPAGLAWQSLSINVNDGSLTTTLGWDQIRFGEGNALVIDVGTLARRDAYKLQLHAELNTLDRSVKLGDNAIDADLVKSIPPGGELDFLVPCSSWSTNFILPESFDGVSANVLINYPLELANQRTTVTTAFRLRSSAPQKRLLLPVAIRQGAIEASVIYNYRNSKTTKSFSFTAGDVALPR